MGRHSVAYIAAREGKATGAAAYVGRAGALALALGIGAAVAGGNGIAYADETGGGESGPEAQSGPPTGGADAAPKAPTTKTPATRVGATSIGDDTDKPASLPGLLASIPKKVAESLTHRATASTTTTTKKRSKSPAAADTDPKPVAPSATTHDTAPSYTDTLAKTAAALSAVTPPPSTQDRVAPATTATATAPLPAARVASAIPAKAKPALANPIATVVSGVLSALGIAPSATNPDGTPTAPMPIITGVLQLVRREIEHFTLQLAAPRAAVTTGQTNTSPAISPGAPSPTDVAATPYGDIGKWMLKSNGEIADYGGEPYQGRELLEPVNVIIVDPTSTSPTQAKYKLNGAMFWSGFAAQPIHSGGFEGTIDDVTYGQEPNLPLLGYSNNLFVFPNDHGRIFGPDPVETSTGYVWSGAFSTEEFGIVHGFLPGHTYVSSNMARNALATALILSGRATYGGMVPLDNAYNTDTTTTGDHDGYAVVLILT